jgi:hypothetical protein
MRLSQDLKLFLNTLAIALIVQYISLSIISFLVGVLIGKAHLKCSEQWGMRCYIFEDLEEKQ